MEQTQIFTPDLNLYHKNRARYSEQYDDTMPVYLLYEKQKIGIYGDMHCIIHVSLYLDMHTFQILLSEDVIFCSLGSVFMIFGYRIMK